MNNKQFLHQSNPNGPNYGRIFRDETQRRVHCPDLYLPTRVTGNIVVNSGSIILLILIALTIWGHA